MGLLEIILIAIGLAMDCFAVSVAGGIILKEFKFGIALRMALMFGLFQGIMPLLGYFAGFYFKAYIEAYDHWIALLILGFLGVKMIREGVAPQEEEDERAKSINPMSWASLLLMSLATSIDALATGIVFVSFSQILLEAICIIAFVSFAFGFIGNYIGAKAGGRFNFRIEILGGIILIAIGLKVFITHILTNC